MQLYNEIAGCVAEVAKEKGIDIVLSQYSVNLPDAGLAELVMTIRTHNLLYASSELDITAEVLAFLDAKK